MKKLFILTFLSGNIRFFSSKNVTRLKKNLKADLKFCLFPWHNIELTKINLIKKKYKPILLKKIHKPNCDKILNKIKYPDYGGNAVGTLYMWDSIRKSFLEIYEFYKKKKVKPDYIIRYRSDILPKGSISIFKHELSNKEIIVPDRYHWNGINDQIFVIRFSDIKLFFDIHKFISKFIFEDKFFAAEYLFQQFIKYKKIKVKYSKFNYNLMRFKNIKKVQNNIKSKMKLSDKINCKINKLKYRIRNFEDYYIKKKYLNKNQEKII